MSCLNILINQRKINMIKRNQQKLIISVKIQELKNNKKILIGIKEIKCLLVKMKHINIKIKKVPIY